VKVYVDSSVVVRLLVSEPGPIEEWGNWELAITSELAAIEVMRALHRLRALGEVSLQQFANLVRSNPVFFEEMEIVPLSPAVLRRAGGPFPTVISAPGAMHLATALLWQEDTGESLTFLTHDRQLRAAARAGGLNTSRS
jgi:predicted nucleic acid-binding protein